MTAEGILGALARATADLSELGVAHALVGGLAVSGRAEVRFTRDVGLAVVAGADAELEAIVGGLRARGYRVRTVDEQRARGWTSRTPRRGRRWWRTTWGSPA